MLSPDFIERTVSILQTYIDEDPNDIGSTFLCALYTELTGNPDVYVTDFFATIHGRYRIPSMKAILGSTIELLKAETEITSAYQLVELLYDLRGPELSAAEFINELITNEFIASD